MGRKARGQSVDHVMILGVRVDCVDFAQTLAMLDLWLEQDPANDLPITTHTDQATQGAHWRCPPPQEKVGQDSPSPVPGGAGVGFNQPSHTRQICTTNPEFVMHARRHRAFAEALRQADLCIPDGGGLLWAARRQGVLLQERVTGSDGIYRICERAAQMGWTVFLLGAAPGIAAAAGSRLQAMYPGLRVVGTYSGSPDDADWPAIHELLQQTEPDLLFVAYGHPRQDLWIAHHRHELPVKVAMGVGGAFDFVAGIVKRAPHWLQELGLEWLYRLVTQPWRWRRMLPLPYFALLVLWKGVEDA